MGEIKDIERLKKKVDSYKSKIQRAKGAKDEALRNLKEDFDVDNIDDAKALLEKLEKKEKKTKAQFDDALDEFKETWGERIEDEN